MYRHTIFHTPSSIVLMVVETRANCRFRAAAMLLRYMLQGLKP